MADTLVYKKVRYLDVDSPDVIHRTSRNGVAESSYIPINDLQNADAVEYSNWLAAGNSPGEAD